MPTKTIKAPRWHVPVDRVNIAQGPGRDHCAHIRRVLAVQPDHTAPVRLKTPASREEFVRPLKFANIFNVEGDTFEFTAFFSGNLVSGIYNMRTRKGWFNLD